MIYEVTYIFGHTGTGKTCFIMEKYGYRAKKKSDVTIQHITIYYNCIGSFSVPDRRNIPAQNHDGNEKGRAIKLPTETMELLKEFQHEHMDGEPVARNGFSVL